MSIVCSAGEGWLAVLDFDLISGWRELWWMWMWMWRGEKVCYVASRPRFGGYSQVRIPQLV
jgi:hypothetical protein